MSVKTYIEFKIQNKLLWRCFVCNDIHFGDRPPVFCPTCGTKNAFVRIDREEALKIIDELGGSIASVDEVIRTWMDFGNANEVFKLVEDSEMFEGLAEGVLENMKNHGQKYCPCRIATGNFTEDLKLICPCNFKIQQRYRESGECFCGLFVRRSKP